MAAPSSSISFVLGCVVLKTAGEPSLFCAHNFAIFLISEYLHLFKTTCEWIGMVNLSLYVHVVNNELVFLCQGTVLLVN